MSNMDIEKTLKILEKETDEVEIYFSKEIANTIEIKNGKFNIFSEDHSSGYGIRAVKDKRMGFYFSNSLDEKAIYRTLKSVKVAEEDEHISLPDRQSYRETKEGYDRGIVEIETEGAMEFLHTLIQPCEKYKVIPTLGLISFGWSEVEILNSHGVHGRDKETLISCYLTTVARDGETSTGSYHDVSRNLDIDFRGIGTRASKLARDSLGGKKIGTITTSVTLRPHAITELLGSVLIPSFSADNVQRGRSILANKVGSKVFSRELDIIDDGTLRGGLGTGKFDGEGVRSQKTKMVEKGALKGYLYDTYTANKENKASTGNAARDSYRSSVQINPSNFIIRGKGKIEDEGLVIHGIIGAHTSNPVSGDFSVETRNAFLNNKPVKKAIISGNIFELLNRIEGFGKDYVQVSTIKTPSIQFAKVRVVS